MSACVRVCVCCYYCSHCHLFVESVVLVTLHYAWNPVTRTRKTVRWVKQFFSLNFTEHSMVKVTHHIGTVSTAINIHVVTIQTHTHTQFAVNIFVLLLFLRHGCSCSSGYLGVKLFIWTAFSCIQEPFLTATVVHSRRRHRHCRFSHCSCSCMCVSVSLFSSSNKTVVIIERSAKNIVNMQCNGYLIVFMWFSAFIYVNLFIYLMVVCCLCCLCACACACASINTEFSSDAVSFMRVRFSHCLNCCCCCFYCRHQYPACTRNLWAVLSF